MITFEQAEEANDYIRDNAKKYAEAKSHREMLEEYLKIKEASIMLKTEGAEHVRRSTARANNEYEELIKGIAAAKAEELEIRWLLTEAQNKIDMWRSYNSTHKLGV